MKQEDFKKQTEEINNKIGKEKAGVIADNIATLMSDNMQMNKTILERDEEIKQLKQDKENLMTTNMNLLQQIPMGEDPVENKQNKKDDKPKASEFDFRTVFDENGNFKN